MKFFKIGMLALLLATGCAQGQEGWETKLNELVTEMVIQKEYTIQYLDGFDGAFIKVEESLARCQRLSEELSDLIDSDEKAALVLERFRERVKSLKPKQEIIKEKGRKNLERIKNIAELEKKYKYQWE